MNSRSTQVVVGLWGNEMTITRGLGHEYSQASRRLSRNSVPVASGTSRMSAPANNGA